MLCKICIAQIQPRKHALDHAHYTDPTRQRGLRRSYRSGIYLLWKMQSITWESIICLTCVKPCRSQALSNGREVRAAQAVFDASTSRCYRTQLQAVFYAFYMSLLQCHIFVIIIALLLTVKCCSCCCCGFFHNCCDCHPPMCSMSFNVDHS